MISSSHRSRGGFLLFEVILALAIFGIAATGFAVALHKVSDLAMLTQSEMRITRILESSLEEAVSIPTLQEGTTSVRIAEGDIDIDTKVELMQDQLKNKDGQSLQEMYRITVIAHWYDTAPRERFVETWRYGRLYQQL